MQTAKLWTRMRTQPHKIFTIICVYVLKIVVDKRRFIVVSEPTSIDCRKEPLRRLVVIFTPRFQLNHEYAWVITMVLCVPKKLHSVIHAHTTWKSRILVLEVGLGWPSQNFNNWPLYSVNLLGIHPHSRLFKQNRARVHIHQTEWSKHQAVRDDKRKMRRKVLYLSARIPTRKHLALLTQKLIIQDTHLL